MGAFTLVIVTIIAQIIVGILGTVEATKGFISFLQTFCDICELSVIIYVCIATKHILNNNGSTDIAKKGNKITVAIIISYITSKIANSYLNSAISVKEMQIPAYIASGVCILATVLAYVWYINYLSKAEKSLK